MLYLNICNLSFTKITQFLSGFRKKVKGELEEQNELLYNLVSYHHTIES